jgi:DNA-directed RNA polymerase specialized sigma24 family protein
VDPLFAAAFQRHLPAIYNIAYRMCLREEDARLTTRDAFVRAYRAWKKRRATGVRGGEEPSNEGAIDAELQLLLLQSVAEVSQGQQRARDVLSFEELDGVIRGDPTQSGVLDELGEVERNRLLWELKQGCLTAVVNCLPAGERVAFILSEVMDTEPGLAAAILGINASALRVRVSRARKKISAYLAPRCAHVDPRNPCRCPSRLGVALTRGFIGDVRGRQVSLRSRPFEQEPPQHDPVALFRTLPLPEPPADFTDELVRELEADGY